MSIEYRVVREYLGNSAYYAIRQVYSSGVPGTCELMRTNVDRLRSDLLSMLEAIDKPVLEEKGGKLVEAI